MPAEDAATTTMVCGGGTDGLTDVGANASAAPLHILLQEDLGPNSIGEKNNNENPHENHNELPVKNLQ